jgi:hypothetical protein
VRHVLSVAILTALLAGCGGAQRTPGPSSEPPLPATALPFLGVACPRPNSIACDRVGVGVHLDRPVVAVVVQVAGRLVRLSPPPDPPDDLWLGYLRHAGLGHGPLHVHARHGLWSGSPAVYPRVRVTVFFADGTVRSLRAEDFLHAGFG